jgi:hypothetical protein
MAQREFSMAPKISDIVTFRCRSYTTCHHEMVRIVEGVLYANVFKNSLIGAKDVVTS